MGTFVKLFRRKSGYLKPVLFPPRQALLPKNADELKKIGQIACPQVLGLNRLPSLNRSLFIISPLKVQPLAPSS